MKHIYLFLFFMLILFQGCSFCGAETSDPTERGLAYIASAIIVHAVISLFR